MLLPAQVSFHFFSLFAIRDCLLGCFFPSHTTFTNILNKLSSSNTFLSYLFGSMNPYYYDNKVPEVITSECLQRLTKC